MRTREQLDLLPPPDMSADSAAMPVSQLIVDLEVVDGVEQPVAYRWDGERWNGPHFARDFPVGPN